MVVRFPLFNKGMSRVVLTEMKFGEDFKGVRWLAMGIFMMRLLGRI